LTTTPLLVLSYNRLQDGRLLRWRPTGQGLKVATNGAIPPATEEQRGGELPTATCRSSAPKAPHPPENATKKERKPKTVFLAFEPFSILAALSAATAILVKVLDIVHDALAQWYNNSHKKPQEPKP